jgi:peptidoglycan glycosyltransferase
VVAAAAFVAGAVLGAERSSSPAPALAAHFVAAWAQGRYGSMYGELAPAARRATSAAAFAQAYTAALTTATAMSERVTGPPRAAAGGVEVVPVRVRTRLFGTLAEGLRLPIVTAPDGTAGVAWSPALAFPGLGPGEALARRMTLPQRAPLLARDGSVLAEGPATAAGARSSPLGAAASAVVGEVGPLPAGTASALEAQGVPADGIVGVSGLELAADARLRGVPGGELLAVPASQAPAAPAGTAVEVGPGTVGRVLASSAAHAAAAVRTTISPAVQTAATTALGGQYGGVVALEPATGQVLGVAGIGLDAVQPPGSTFKMVTVSGALEAGITRPSTVYPYATAATLDGVLLHNANGEECGGSLTEAFAVSCNSVFAPLGVHLGAARLVAQAERYGFNHPPGIPGAAESTLPPAAAIQGELAVGSTAIGQDQVLASPLEMATVAATVADGGRRPAPNLLGGSAGGSATARVRAISPATARTVRGLMLDVVRFGTGTAAAIPGVEVAGKTGTAELSTPAACGSEQAGAEAKPAEGHANEEHAQSASCVAEESNPKNTDAWFAAFAPALHPKVAVAVLMVRDGAGGATAAPVARQVLEAALAAGV